MFREAISDDQSRDVEAPFTAFCSCPQHSQVTVFCRVETGMAGKSFLAGVCVLFLYDCRFRRFLHGKLVWVCRVLRWSDVESCISSRYFSRQCLKLSWKVRHWRNAIRQWLELLTTGLTFYLARCATNLCAGCYIFLCSILVSFLFFILARFTVHIFGI